jgi:hypothetical protein
VGSFVTDGVYHGYKFGQPYQSGDGLHWVELSAEFGILPPVDGPLAFYQDEGSLYATHSTRGSLRVFEWADDGWSEIEVEVPTGPGGLSLVADTDDVRAGTSVWPTFVSGPTMVVLRDGHPVNVGRNGRGGAGMVAAGGAIYAVSFDESASHRLWRSIDGVDWEEFDTGLIEDPDLAWVFLTGGHDRLMLTVGRPVQGGHEQEVWTSTDGMSWDEVDLPVSFDYPVVPQVTDFGWMMTKPGRIWDSSGLWNPKPASLLISGDGLEWSDLTGQVTIPVGRLIATAPFPYRYEAGLLTREHPSGAGTSVWRILDE